MATGLMNLLLILLPPHMAAKSWQRDRTEAWREHLGVVPVTSDRVIFAKSHLWLMLIFIGKLATLVVAMLLALAAVMKSALGGGPIDLFAWMGTLREQMGIDMGAAVALWLPLAVIQGILGVVKSVLWWVLIFEFIILFGLQGMGPLVNLTIVGLIILSIGGMFGFGMMLAVGVVAILVPGPTAMMVLQVLAGMVEVALLGAGCWFFWRALKRMVAKHYHLSG
jgi:hypothetical protein